LASKYAKENRQEVDISVLLKLASNKGLSRDETVFKRRRMSILYQILCEKISSFRVEMGSKSQKRSFK
jgi:hypothetical protein